MFSPHARLVIFRLDQPTQGHLVLIVILKEGPQRAAWSVDFQELTLLEASELVKAIEDGGGEV